MTGSIACVYPLLKHPLLTKCSLFHKNNVRSATCDRCTASNQSNLHAFTNTHSQDPRDTNQALYQKSRGHEQTVRPSRRRINRASCTHNTYGSSRSRTSHPVCTAAKLRIPFFFFSFAILYLEVLAGQTLCQKAEELLADLLQLLSKRRPSKRHHWDRKQKFSIRVPG